MYRAEKVQEVGRAAMTQLSYCVLITPQLGNIRRNPPRLIVRE
jgi:hypothetical protein